MSELPKGWVLAQLPDVAFFQEGPGLRKFQYRDSGVAFLNIRTLVNERIDLSLCKFLDPDEVDNKYQHFLLQEGDIVCSTSGTIGKTAVVRGGDLPLILNTSIVRFRSLSDELISNSWVYYFLKSDSFFMQAEKEATGTAQKNIGPSHLRNFCMPLPPRAEQARIAAKLDELLAQVDTLKARIDAIPMLLKRFRQSVLAAAVSGRLTEEWRRVRCKSPEDQSFVYPVRKLGVLARFIDYRGKTPEKVESGIPLITAKNIRPGYISREPQEFIRPEAYEGWMTRGLPQVGDVVITTEAPLGNVAVIDIKERFALAQRAICLQFHEGFLSSFAAIALQSPLLQEDLVRRSTGTTVKGIKASVLKEIDLPAPTIDEQTEIVRRVEQLFAFADQLEAKVASAKSRIDHLTQSILAKAFRGELVPQDPNDEPASVLLERIKAQRAAAPKARRGRQAATLS